MVEPWPRMWQGIGLTFQRLDLVPEFAYSLPQSKAPLPQWGLLRFHAQHHIIAMELNAKQLRFVREYLIDLHVGNAALRAGYSPKTASQIGSRLLKNVKIQAEIAKQQSKRADKLEITADKVVEELAKIGFSNMMDYIRVGPEGDAYVDLSALNRDKAAAIQEVTVEDFTDGRGEDSRDVRRVKFKLADKRAALVDLGKHLGLFVERHELTGKNGGPIQTEEISAIEALESRIAVLASRSQGSDPKPH